MHEKKPMKQKLYGSIPHLPESRMGPADHHCSEGQARIATDIVRDYHDTVIVQEKLDGSNCGVCRLNGDIIPLTRAGYVANSSKYEMHHKFYDWVMANKNRFEFLNEGERLVGEWLYKAHGTKYNLNHEPFVVFDLIDSNNNRIRYLNLIKKIYKFDFTPPYLVNYGKAISVKEVMKRLGNYGKHGAEDYVEGAVWRVERKNKVDFLVKYVRPEKIDGLYIKDDILNKFK